MFVSGQLFFKIACIDSEIIFKNETDNRTRVAGATQVFV
jgi:hypothetical protein